MSGFRASKDSLHLQAVFLVLWVKVSVIDMELSNHWFSSTRTICYGPRSKPFTR